MLGLLGPAHHGAYVNGAQDTAAHASTSRGRRCGVPRRQAGVDPGWWRIRHPRFRGDAPVTDTRRLCLGSAHLLPHGYLLAYARTSGPCARAQSHAAALRLRRAGALVALRGLEVSSDLVSVLCSILRVAPPHTTPPPRWRGEDHVIRHKENRRRDHFGAPYQAAMAAAPTRLYLGRLPPDVRREDIEDLFRGVGVRVFCVTGGRG